MAAMEIDCLPEGGLTGGKQFGVGPNCRRSARSPTSSSLPSQRSKTHDEELSVSLKFDPDRLYLGADGIVYQVDDQSDEVTGVSGLPATIHQRKVPVHIINRSLRPSTSPIHGCQQLRRARDDLQPTTAKYDSGSAAYDLIRSSTWIQNDSTNSNSDSTCKQRRISSVGLSRQEMSTKCFLYNFGAWPIADRGLQVNGTKSQMTVQRCPTSSTRCHCDKNLATAVERSIPQGTGWSYAGTTPPTTIEEDLRHRRNIRRDAAVSVDSTYEWIQTVLSSPSDPALRRLGLIQINGCTAPSNSNCDVTQQGAATIWTQVCRPLSYASERISSGGIRSTMARSKTMPGVLDELNTVESIDSDVVKPIRSSSLPFPSPSLLSSSRTKTQSAVTSLPDRQRYSAVNSQTVMASATRSAVIRHPGRLIENRQPVSTTSKESDASQSRQMASLIIQSQNGYQVPENSPRPSRLSSASRGVTGYPGSKMTNGDNETFHLMTKRKKAGDVTPKTSCGGGVTADNRQLLCRKDRSAYHSYVRATVNVDAKDQRVPFEISNANLYIINDLNVVSAPMTERNAVITHGNLSNQGHDQLRLRRSVTAPERVDSSNDMEQSGHSSPYKPTREITVFIPH